MVNNSKYKVSSDIKKNRLYITMPLIATKSEMKRVYTDVRFCVADLKPGFDVIDDLSCCKLGHLNAVGIYKKISDYLVVSKAGRVIRIIGKKSILFKQALAFAEIIKGYKPVYVYSLQEAEEELLKPIKPNALRFHIHQRQVEYSTNQDEGKGYLLDLSTSGCAVEGATYTLSVDQEIKINIPLFQEIDALTSFAMSAKVVRVLDKQFAVMFLDINQERKEKLYQCLVNEIQNEKV